MITAIVINSNVTSTHALPHLLESLKTDQRYTNYKILVFIGGHYQLSDYEIETSNNITTIKCNYNTLDFTSFIALSELYTNDVNNIYLYLHDTCKVGTKFFDKIEKIDFTNITSIRINKGFSNNIGFYTQEIINKNKQFLQTIKTNNPVNIELKKKIISYEDKIFRDDLNNIVLDNYEGWQYTGPTDYYNTGTMRIVEHYPNLDLFKIKANWGQAWKDGNWILNN